MLSFLLQVTQTPTPVVVIDRDDVVITSSCIVEPGSTPILDANGDGVVHIRGDDITVSFVNKTLAGAPEGTDADLLQGIGVRIQGRNVTVRGAMIRGYKTAIWASDANGLVLEGNDVSGNYRQRLKSGPRAEDLSDWLWPHENDANEWLTNYGAGIYVENSKSVVLRRNTAKNGQNGICLRRVDESTIYDNDMSFLSGWGLAMYRSSRNQIDHNSFDFCIRGYSHGRYARGQDSAGILCFEQCSDNLFAFNSATHGGDGFFGFAGPEALEGDVQQAGVGNNRNLLYGNDFSYAAAIGIEMTFSFDNRFERNRLVGSNYGVWGGYSSRTVVLDNLITDNTLAGIAVEHGSHWNIVRNQFARNARAIELWWDDDADLLAKPWAKLNPTVSADHWIGLNRFDADTVQLELRGPNARIAFDETQSGTERAKWKIEAQAEVIAAAERPALSATAEQRLNSLPGRRVAIDGRAHLAGRERIVMTEWGPYDWETPYLHRVEDVGGAHAWRLLGNDIAIGVDAGPDIVVKMDASSAQPTFLLSPRKPGTVLPYTLNVRIPSRALQAQGLLLGAKWNVTVGAYQTDPREEPDVWRNEVKKGPNFESAALSFAFGHKGPSELVDAPQNVRDAKIGSNHFGTLATSELTLPAGRWRFVVNSDDGVRVSIDGRRVIDNWTHHGPTLDTAEFEVEPEKPHRFELEHFELDGWSVLDVTLEAVAP